MGLFENDLWIDRLAVAISEAAAPYGSQNRFSLSQSGIILPGDLLVRLQSQGRGPPLERFARKAKADATEGLHRILTQSHTTDMAEYPDFVHEEEQGFLVVHVFAVPTSGDRSDRAKRPSAKEKRGRKRSLEVSQGGDPRVALQNRMAADGVSVWTINQALNEDLSTEPQRVWESDTLTFHVAVWRRPFYVRGCYTKSQRNVSQTPFYVETEERGVREKLGATSVEEQIVPVVVQACLGVSKLNNDLSKPDVVFGMVKFHASGREDMDVLMLLPKEPNPNVTGRPFVCEVTDAFRMIPPERLLCVVREVNNMLPEESPAGDAARYFGMNEYGVGISTDFDFAPSDAFSNLQSETEHKVKYYGCRCWSQNPLPKTNEELNAMLGTFPLEIHQKTPIRVLHRRPNIVRSRHVLHAIATIEDDHFFQLHLSTDAGTCECSWSRTTR